MSVRRSFTVLRGLAAAAVAAVLLLPRPGLGQLAVRNQGFVPFSDAPIDYGAEADDPVARLQRRLEAGAATLRWDARHGYLPSLLEHLEISATSQMLVFSKTSFQYRRISPATPRAIYFNDDVYVGRIHGGGALEMISVDADQGAIFYLLDDQPEPRPRARRAELDCTVCHVAPATRNVPGVLVRSVFALPSGAPAGRAAAFVTAHDSPYEDRFGGWYVTGRTGSLRHMGNVTVADRDRPEVLDREAGANVTTLDGRVDTSGYLTPHSDVVAQLVHAHQTQAHNVLTRASFLTRIALHQRAATNRAAGRLADAPDANVQARIDGYADELLRYLLFENEPPLAGPVTGTSGFAGQFQARGPRDARGRSLRDLDLETRLFRYRLSYLVYTEAFDALPAQVRDVLLPRLLAILTGAPDGDEFWWLGRDERRAIFDILLDTKQDLPPAWRDHARRLTRPALGRAQAPGHGGATAPNDARPQEAR